MGIVTRTVTETVTGEGGHVCGSPGAASSLSDYCLCTPVLQKMIYYLPVVALDARRCAPLPCRPILEESHLFSTVLPQSRQRRRQVSRIDPNEFVRPNCDGLRPLGTVAEGQTGHAEHGGLFGDAAGIGDHASGMLHQIVEF